MWQESESTALDKFIGDQSVVSSVLLKVQARRGTFRVAPNLLPRTDLLLSYDDRLVAAAASHGIKTATPA